eukprot:TRINITY_DN759_c0_g1_i1.p1 TRINITY_DN759_c0_g1~~TRINITY_DN759_c0_g1_i1.p1  ORF type:complete len:1030 (+),score=241.41 TRINITY_DN759_c0_g1_i1:61-3090(+)
MERRHADCGPPVPEGVGKLYLCLFCGHRQLHDPASGVLGACDRCSTKPVWKRLPAGSPPTNPSPWERPDTAQTCSCGREFDHTQQDYLHCRKCGRVCCSSCGSRRIVVAAFGAEPQPVCGSCYAEHVERSLQLSITHPAGARGEATMAQLLSRLLLLCFPEGLAVTVSEAATFSVELATWAGCGAKRWSREDWRVGQEDAVIAEVGKRLGRRAAPPHVADAAPIAVSVIFGGEPWNACAHLLSDILKRATDYVSVTVSKEALKCPRCSRVQLTRGAKQMRCASCGAVGRQHYGWGFAPADAWVEAAEHLSVELDLGEDFPAAPLCVPERLHTSEAVSALLDALQSVRGAGLPVCSRPFVSEPADDACHVNAEAFAAQNSSDVPEELMCAICGARQQSRTVFSLVGLGCSRCGQRVNWKTVPYTSRPPEEWVMSSEADTCASCSVPFVKSYLASGKHHCRKCGKVFCRECCPAQRMVVHGYGRDLQPACTRCYEGYLQEAVRVEISRRDTKDEMAMALVLVRLFFLVFPSGVEVACKEGPFAVTVLPDIARGTAHRFDSLDDWASEQRTLLEMVGERLRMRVSSGEIDAASLPPQSAAVSAMLCGRSMLFASGGSGSAPFVIVDGSTVGLGRFHGFAEGTAPLMTQEAFLETIRADCHEEIMLMQGRQAFEQSVLGCFKGSEAAVWKQFAKDIDRQDMTVSGRRCMHKEDAAAALAAAVQAVLPRWRTRARIETSGSPIHSALACALTAVLEVEGGGEVGVVTSRGRVMVCPACGRPQVKPDLSPGSQDAHVCVGCGAMKTDSAGYLSYYFDRAKGWAPADDHFGVSLVGGDGSGLPIPVGSNGPPTDVGQLEAIAQAVRVAKLRAAHVSARPVKAPAPGLPEWLPEEVHALPAETRELVVSLAGLCQQGVAAASTELAMRQYGCMDHNVHVVGGTGRMAVRVRAVDNDTDLEVTVSKTFAVSRADMDTGEKVTEISLQTELQFRLFSKEPITIRVEGARKLLHNPQAQS